MQKSKETRWQIAIAICLVSLGLTGCFKVSSDVGALRDSVVKSAGVEWEQQIEIGVGAITLNLARAGLAFVDLDPEAKAALHAVRSADVGVYKRRHGRKQLKCAAILAAADKAMTARGWDRLVGVVNRSELVAIYAPGGARSARSLKVCLVTVNEDEFVVAGARSDLKPLMEIAFNHADWHQMARSPL